MQSSTSDLDAALAFVIRQVEDEAKRSDAPLDDAQRYLLNHLPATSDLPSWPDPELPPLIPRDLVYEKLCSLAKAARLHDLRIRPVAAPEWELAAAVLNFNRHPMLGLLQWAGVKERRPWWERLLLVGTSIVAILCAMGLMLYAETHRQRWTWVEWVVFILTCSSVVVCAYLASRKFRGWQIMRTIENCRREIALR